MTALRRAVAVAIMEKRIVVRGVGWWR